MTTRVLLIISTTILGLLGVASGYADTANAVSSPAQTRPAVPSPETPATSVASTTAPRSVAAELKLNATQLGAFRNSSKQMQAAMLSCKAVKQQLRALIQADKFDEAAAHKMIQKNNAELEVQLVAAAKAKHEFYASLTPEQKTKFNNLPEDLQDNNRGRGRGRRGSIHCDQDE